MRKRTPFFIVFSAFCWILLPTVSLRAQLSLTAIGTPATMDFDIPGSSTCSGAGSPWTDNVTIPNCYTNRSTYAYSTGCNNTGALHIAGIGGETAFGGRASNSTTLIIWGVRIVNNTGQPISALSIRYRGEQWNSAQSNVNNTVAFSYAVSASPITNVTSGTYTNFPALNMSNLVTMGGCAGGGSQIDGNTTFSDIAACMPVNILPGQEIMLRWYETNDGCNDHMLCIDDLEVTPLNASLASQPVTGPDTVCPGDTATYSVPPLPGVTYAWSALPAGASYIGTPGNTAQVDWGSAAPGTYTLTVTPSGNFCGITLTPVSMNVTVNAPTPVTITAAPALVCPGQPVTLTSSSATGNTWNTVPPQTTPSITVTTPGTYIVTVSGLCGTPGDTIDIQAGSPPTVNLGSDQLVCGGAVNFVLDAQNPGATYEWQDGSGNQVLNVTAAGTYWVKVTTPCGTASDTVHILSQTAPTVNLGNDTLVCGTTNILLNAQNPGNAVYLWQDNSGNATFTVTQPGHYYVTVTNDCGSASDTLDVIALPAPQVDLGPDVTICLGTPVTFDATYPGATYLWQDGSGNATYTASQAGTYHVRVSNDCGQTADTVSISLKPGPQATLQDTTLDCGITAVTLDAQNPGSGYVWSTGETSRVISVNEPGLYWVEMDYCGLTVTDSLTVSFTGPASTFFAPNTFTPNGDGTNDHYRIMGVLDDITSFYAAIYNRWGEILYSTSDPDFRWDGMYLGKPIVDGVYYAVFRIRQDCGNDAEVEYNTLITVVR